MTQLTALPHDEKHPLLARLTVADGLMLAVWLLAGVLRLADLGYVPLSPAEAAEAWRVWAFWQPNTAAAPPASPAYFTLTALLVPILGSSDTVMRLVPALFGWAVVALPWLLREKISRWGALLAALLTAVSPILTASSRTADGSSMALFAAGLLAVAYLRRKEGEKWAWTAAAALGLGLGSAPLFYTLLAGGIVAVVVHIRFMNYLAGGNNGRFWKIPVTHWHILITILTFFAANTLFLLYPPGLGSAANILAAWLAQFATTPAIGQIADPFMAIIRYDMLLFVLGIPAMIYLTVKLDENAMWQGALVYWLVAIIVIIALQGSTLANTQAFALVGYWLVGVMVYALWQDRLNSFSFVLAGGFTFLGLAIFVNISRYLRLVTAQPTLLTPLWTAVVLFTLALATLFYLFTFSETAVYQSLILSLTALFVFFGWGTAWWLGHNTNDPRERLVTEGTDTDVRLLTTFMDTLSYQVARHSDGMAVLSTVESPVLRWYLRDMAQVTFANGVPFLADTAVLITPSSQDSTLPVGTDYIGTPFDLTQSCPNGTAVSTQPIIDTLKWWFFQEAPPCSEPSGIIVWLRADLAEIP
ncbi:MAG: hypothetical protein Kow0080_25230 [Candidatus Promineifilaceae bacterium]